MTRLFVDAAFRDGMETDAVDETHCCKDIRHCYSEWLQDVDRLRRATGIVMENLKLHDICFRFWDIEREQVVYVRFLDISPNIRVSRISFK